MNKIKNQTGFTLLELMVSMGIGLFLISGVFYVYLNSSQSQKSVETEVKLIDNARFALQTISFDLKHAGIYGALNHVARDKIDTDSIANFINISGQCGGVDSGWVVDVENPLFSTNDTNLYSSDCIPSSEYATGDVLEVRYVERIDQANTLFSDVLYINSDVSSGEFFLGSGSPITSRPLGENYKSVAKAYYISSYTDVPADGIPSLRMVSLQPGPVVTETLLLSGVSDLQMKFGLTADKASAESTSIVTWQEPTVDLDWKRVVAAKIWLVMQSTQATYDIDTSTTLNVGGVNVSFPNDGFRRVMVSTSVQLRNMNTGY